MVDIKAVDADSSNGRVRLVQFEIERLYDEFNYIIPLDTKSHVTAVIAPNGSGKTLCLRLIYGLFRNDWELFEKTVFNKAIFTFSDGAKITIRKPQIQLEPEDRDESLPSLLIDFIDKLGEEHTPWNPHRLKRIEPEVLIDRYMPFLTRIHNDSWRDRRTNEIFKLNEIMGKLTHELPPGIIRKFFHNSPEFISSFLSKITCTLIETQRLFILDDVEDGRYIPGRESRKTQYAISRKASTLKEIISTEMNRYAALSQSLDRTFPSRVISTHDRLPQDEIEQQLLVLDKKRKELMDVGILDSERDVSVALPGEKLEPAISTVLSVYIEDNKKKLDSLDHLYERIALFKKLVDARFGRKDVKISKEKGLDVLYGDREVPIERLSSGEQHQLVLFFELLFETKKNSLILIDEPEISLHVSWQKKFITDLMSIIELNGFDVVLATHSPQLIGKWSDLVVELGDVFDGNTTPDWAGSSK